MAPTNIHARLDEEPGFTSSPYEPDGPAVQALSDIDLLDPDLYRCGNPHAIWRMLREEAPLFWHEKGTRGTDDKGFWVVSRYDDMMSVYRNTRLWSSEDGPFLDLRVEDTPTRILASIDGSDHKLRRAIVAKFFTPMAIARMSDSVRRTVTGLLNDVCERGECDFVTEIAQKLPVQATCDLLGISADEVGALGAILFAAENDQSLQNFNAETLAFFNRVIEERKRTNTRDSIVGAVAHAEVDGEPLSDEDASHLMWVLFFGGIDTTVHAVSGSLLSLFHHPDQLAAIRRDPTLASSGADELLRWTSISHANKRRAREDVEIHGVTIKKDDFITMWAPSGNRDETVFDDPFRLDLSRVMSKTKPPSTFGGGGAHQCLGQFFAKLELQTLLEELFKRMPDVQQAGPAVRAKHFTMLLSPIKSLPIRFTPSAPVM